MLYTSLCVPDPEQYLCTIYAYMGVLVPGTLPPICYRWPPLGPITAANGLPLPGHHWARHSATTGLSHGPTGPDIQPPLGSHMAPLGQTFSHHWALTWPHWARHSATTGLSHGHHWARHSATTGLSLGHHWARPPTARAILTTITWPNVWPPRVPVKPPPQAGREPQALSN